MPKCKSCNGSGRCCYSSDFYRDDSMPCIVCNATGSVGEKVENSKKDLNNWIISDSVSQDIKNRQSLADEYWESITTLFSDKDRVLKIQNEAIEGIDPIKIGDISARNLSISIYLADMLYVDVAFDYDILLAGNSGAYKWMGKAPQALVDANLNPRTYKTLILHEAVELYLLKEEKWPYKRAHQVASFLEYYREKEYLISIGKLPKDFKGSLEGQGLKTLIGNK
jgi:hypothetical protein